MKFDFYKNEIIKICYRIIKILIYRLIYNPFYCFFCKIRASVIIDHDKKYRLVVCHNGGGGTDSYLNIKYGKITSVLILRKKKSADIDYVYSIQNLDLNKTINIAPKDLKVISGVISEVNIVSIDSFMSLKNIMNWFISLGVPVTYDIHDYHCIWFDSHLIRDGQYLSKELLQTSKFSYVYFSFTYNQYHKMWEDFFRSVYRINVFSKSSLKIFSEFFPDCVDKVLLTPHSLNYLHCGKINLLSHNFTVGVFGSILGEDKGCKVVQSFLEYSKDKNYQVFFNGELKKECMVSAPNIHYQGRYEVALLDKIIEEQQISVVFFPSICPETFSYTVAELMYVGVPVVCFNIGAQAEKISSYKFGQIITENSNEAIFDALQKAYIKGQKA